MFATTRFVSLLIGMLVAGCSGHDSAPAPADPAVEEVAKLVLVDIASPAFGGQKLARRCVVTSAPTATADGGTLVEAHLAATRECAIGVSMLWLHVRAKGATTWNAEFMGPPPSCWKGVPANLIDAVAKASGIKPC